MDTLAITILLKVKPGRENEVQEFLTSALPMMQAEAGAANGFALKMGPDEFGIFDTFPDNTGRDAHLSGEIEKALFAQAEELLTITKLHLVLIDAVVKSILSSDFLDFYTIINRRK